MVLFDMVLLLTQVPVVESHNLLSQHFSEDIWPYLGMSSYLHISPLVGSSTSRQMEWLWAPLPLSCHC